MSADEGSGTCWLCYQEDIQPEAVLLHCGHGGLCLSCASDLWRRRLTCPMCRTPIDLIARIGDSVTVDGKLVVSPQLPPKPEADDL